MKCKLKPSLVTHVARLAVCGNDPIDAGTGFEKRTIHGSQDQIFISQNGGLDEHLFHDRWMPARSMVALIFGQASLEGICR